MDIAILGYGTVGSGVYKVLTENQAIVAASAGEPVNVKYVLDLRDFPGDPVQDKIVHDVQVILDDPEIKIVIEVMGGVEPAYTFVKKALLAGKSAATSNKELVAKHGAELLQIAREHDQNFMFEASVGGGIPVIRPMYRCLTADVIHEVCGILNGTTNYMLTKMDREGANYDDVLKQAQALGYAELHPEADVEGYDPARKIAILSSLVTGHQVNFEDVSTEGITKITEKDFGYAKALGMGIKLVAKSVFVPEGIYSLVAPMLVTTEDPLYAVNDVFNAVSVTGNMLGEVMFYGKGAGKEATASAVVSDAVECVRNMGRPDPIRWSDAPAKVLDIQDYACSYLLRVSDAETAEAKLQELFGEIDILHVLDGELGLITPKMSIADFNEKISHLDNVLGRVMIK